MSFSISSPPPGTIRQRAHGGELQPRLCLSLFSLALLLSLFGLTMLYSTSYDKGSVLFFKQMAWAGLGVFSASVSMLLGYRRFTSLSLHILVVSAILLVVPRFLPPVKGAYRWIRLPGGFSVQPSELAKIAVILFFAKFCASRQLHINSLRNLLLSLGTLCLMAILTGFVGQDLGTTLLICFVVWMMFFVAGMRLLVILGLPLLLGPPLLIAIWFFDAERWSRIATIFDPEKDPLGSGYQLLNSLMALGSGGWTGQGFTESKMKAYYLPEAHTDFILSIVGEELGYAVMLLVVVLYAAVFALSLAVSFKARLKEGMLLSFGFGTLLAAQAVINIGVISGFFPTKGMPAPFISYGGSNILMAWTAIGLVCSVAVAREPQRRLEHASIKIGGGNEGF